MMSIYFTAQSSGTMGPVTGSPAVDYAAQRVYFASRKLLADVAAMVEKQKKARATWWDRPQTLEEQRKAQESNVPQRGYVYYHNP